MSDLDALMGISVFAANTGDRFFMENVPDSYEHKSQAIRDFSTVALFDRKCSRAFAFGPGNAVSLAFYLSLARRLGRTQPVEPKFFLIVGGDRPPWQMVEVCIHSAEILHEHTLTSANWQQVWQIAGLTALREELRRWIDPAKGMANGGSARPGG